MEQEHKSKESTTARAPRTAVLYSAGQSVWLDYISACMIQSGELKEMADSGIIYGLTSNPTIFAKSIGSGLCNYPADIQKLRAEGKSTLEICDEIMRRDVGMAADILRPVYDRTGGLDGFASLEVSPELAHDTDRTIAEAKRLFKLLNRPNVFIKVPATREGIIAIKSLIGAGININVTLIFSRDYYREVMNAYIEGLRELIASGGDPRRVASVASFFVSRVDTAVDKRLDVMREVGTLRTDEHKRLRGQAATANARLAYKDFKRVFQGAGFVEFAEAGARPQRPLWASTGTKDPAYDDLKYVEPLVAPQTVNTMPRETLDALLEKGNINAGALESGIHEARSILEQLSEMRIHMDAICEDLLNKGVEAFAKSYRELIEIIDEIR